MCVCVRTCVCVPLSLRVRVRTSCIFVCARERVCLHFVPLKSTISSKVFLFNFFLVLCYYHY